MLDRPRLPVRFVSKVAEVEVKPPTADGTDGRSRERKTPCRHRRGLFRYLSRFGFFILISFTLDVWSGQFGRTMGDRFLHLTLLLELCR